MATEETGGWPENGDSRTASITAKRTNNMVDLDDTNGHVPTQDPFRNRERTTCEYEGDDAQSPASSVSASVRDEQDGGEMSIGSDSEDYHIGIRSTNESSMDYSTTNQSLCILQAEKDPATALANLDVTLPLGDILEHIPSLKDVNTKLAEAPRVVLPVRENKAYVRWLTRAVHEYREAKNRLRKMGSAGEIDRSSERYILHEAEIRLAWCQYYPLEHSWHPPPPPASEEPQHESKSPAMKEAKARFLQIVTDCVKDGNLLELRAGNFSAVDDLLGIKPFKRVEDPVGTRTRELSEIKTQLRKGRLRLRKGEKNGKIPNSLRHQSQKIGHLEVDFRYCNYHPCNRSYQPLPTFKKPGASPPDIIADLNGSPAQLWKFFETLTDAEKLQAVKEGRFVDDAFVEDHDRAADGKDVRITSQRNNRHLGQNSLSLPYDVTRGSSRNTAAATNGNLRNRSATSKQTREHLSLSPASDSVMTNIDHHETIDRSESGEISTGTDNSPSKATNITRKERVMAWNPDDRAIRQLDGANDVEADAGKRAPVLADLSPEDLDAQMKYFHFSRRSDDVSLNGAVRCLCCGQKGHMAVDCDHLICSKCGAYNMHALSNCDNEINNKCAKCREAGHQETTCPYKLKNLTPQDKICDLCNNRGHFDENCELFWRTAGAPWEAKLDPSNLRIYCYECGKTGHLGNDCPTRDPGKDLGTSTWSMKRQPPSPPNDSSTAKGLSIRRTAPKSGPQKRAPPEDFGDSSNFKKMKASQPSGKRQIRIKSSVAKSSTVDSFQPQWTPVSQPLPKTQQPGPGKRRKQGPQNPTAATPRPPPLPPGPPPTLPPQHYSGGAPLQYHDRNRYPDYEADLQYNNRNQPPPTSYHTPLPHAPHHQQFSHLPPRPPPQQFPPRLGDYDVQPPVQWDNYRLRHGSPRA